MLYRLVALAAVAALLLACDAGAPDERVADPAAVRFERASANTIAHGERLGLVLGCAGCHGADLTGRDWSEPGFGELWTANLTRAIRAYSDAQLAEVIRGGAVPGGRELWEMPSHLFTKLSDEDMAALIAWLRTKSPAGEAHPPPTFDKDARREIAAGTFTSSRAHVLEKGELWPADAGPSHRLGRYIVRATCAECHGMDLRGGQPFPGAVPRPDLRIVAAYDKPQFERLLRTGIAAGDREVSLMSEVARGRYKHLTDAELEAVYRYLHAVGSAPDAAPQ